MRNLINIAIWYTMFAISGIGYSQEVIFLHHSIGNYLFKEGNVDSLIDSYNISNNKSINVSERTFPNDPWSFNYPYDYWKLWVDGSCNSANKNIECLNTLAESYDMVIFKHCAPAAAIKEDTGIPDINSDVKTLGNYKEQYRALRSLFDSYPDTKFMVLTLAPLHRLSTSTYKANRANEFVQWVKTEWLTEDGKSHPNIFIFDFFSLVAEMDENPENGFRYCLKYEYERNHNDSEAHPNTLANETVGPIFAQFIVNTIEDIQQINVTGITVTGAGGATAITTNDGTLQLSPIVTPDNATNKTVTWSLQNGMGQASINSSGLVTAIKDGTVTAKATATDGSGVSGSLVITISGQTEAVAVTDITVTGDGGSTTITSKGGTLQLFANISPSNATNKSVTWSIQNGTGQASINSSGLVTAIMDGTVTAKATANDGSGIFGSLVITITSTLVAVTSIVVYGEGFKTSISTPGGTLQLHTNIAPSNATDKSVTWSVQNGTGQASIDENGLLTAIADGTVTVKATANDGSGIHGILIITIENQNLPTDVREKDSATPFVTVSESRIIVHLNEFITYKYISIYNMLGNLMINQKVSDMVSTFDVSAFHSGIYIIVLTGIMEERKIKVLVP